MKEIVELLKQNKKTISTMESCTGGGVANSITNIEGSSEILKFSAVTYSNEFKIKMGVDKNIIDKYTVYSIETAQEMSRNISDFTNSNYGVGITGQINRQDPNNITEEDNKIYISIYDKDNNKYYNETLIAINSSRSDNKEVIINKIVEMLKDIIKGDK
ncbi:MAG: CinA family protein [Lactobacillales bacterium]|nr:CinA family protein [Lactobacillales bacterium]